MSFLTHDSFINAQPANGLGMVLAEKGTLDHAKDVFARVREVSAEALGDVWINLAHVYLAQNKHNEVKMKRERKYFLCADIVPLARRTIANASKHMMLRNPLPFSWSVNET